MYGHWIPISLFILGFLGAIPLAAQAPNEEQRLKLAEQQIQQAEELYGQADFKGSLQQYQVAADIYQKINRSDKYAICYNGIGNNYIDLTRYKEAFAQFQRVLETFRDLRKQDTSFVADSSSIADAYEGFGRYHMNFQVNFDSALAWHNRALELRLRIFGEQNSKVAHSYYFIGLCYSGFGEDSIKFQGKNPIKLQLEYLEKALAIQQATLGEQHYQTADTYQALGDYYYDVKSDHRKGTEYHQKALAIRLKLFGRNHPKIASSYIDLAKYHRLLGEYERELEYLDKALQIQLLVLGDNHRDVAITYALLANRYRSMGDVDRAISYYERAGKILVGLLTENSLEVAEIYSGLANCYNDLEQRPAQYQAIQKALQIRQKIYGQQHVRLGHSYIELGSYYLRLNKADSALVYYNKALDLWKKSYGDTHYLVTHTYDLLAQAYQVQNNIDQEYFYLNEALNKKKTGGSVKQQNVYDEFAADMGSVETETEALGQQLFTSYLNLMYFYKRKKDYRLALGYCQNALSSVCPTLHNKQTDLYANPSIADLSRNILWLEAFQQKAALFLKLYQEQSKEIKDLEFAVVTYRDALRLIDTLRTNFTSDGSKENLTRRSLPVYEGAVAAYYELHQQKGDKKYIAEAYSVLEHGRAFILLQALQNIQAKNTNVLPADLLAKEELLRRNLAYYSDYKNRSNANQQEFDQAYFQTKRSYDSLMNALEKEYPRYFEMKYENKPIQLETIEDEVLTEKNAILEYLVGDEHLYVFVLTKGKQSFYQLPITRDFNTTVNTLRSNLTNYKAIANDPNQAYKTFVETSSLVYQKYVAPFIKDLPSSTKQLIIVPDGILSYIPFEVLLTEQPSNLNTPNYAELQYLLKKYEINYTYSVSLLLKNLNASRGRHNGLCIGFAPSYDNVNTPNANAELPWANEELKNIQKVYKGNYYFGLDANKDVFLNKANNYAIVHLAMHGVVDWRNSLKSFLAFAPQANDSTNEYSHLYAYEIHNLSLNADLVVLSACETGFGKVIRGEGVLSLARGFMYAGVPSVVTTLWQVNDFTSANLMMLFYKNLDAGMSKSEALQKAKLEFLTRADHITGHPAFWASFVTLGNPAPINLGMPGWAWALIITAMLGTVGGVTWVVVKRRRRRQLEEAEKAGIHEPNSENIHTKEGYTNVLLQHFVQRKQEEAKEATPEETDSPNP